MLFAGQDLQDDIVRTANPNARANQHGGCCLTILQDVAGIFDFGTGVGKQRPLRSLQSPAPTWPMNAGGRRTQLLTGDSGEYIAHPLIPEHQPLQGLTL